MLIALFSYDVEVFEMQYLTFQDSAKVFTVGRAKLPSHQARDTCGQKCLDAKATIARLNLRRLFGAAPNGRATRWQKVACRGKPIAES